MTDTSDAAKARQQRPERPFSDDLLDEILGQLDGQDGPGLLGQSGLIEQLKRQLAERMLAAELGHHLQQERASARLGIVERRPPNGHAGLALAGRPRRRLVGKVGRPGHRPAPGAGRHGKRLRGDAGRGQPCMMLALMLWAIATWATDALDCAQSSSICSINSAL